MREILFRGKRTDNNDWVYGSLVTMQDKCSYGDANIFSNLHIMEIEEMDMRCYSQGCEVYIDNSLIQIYEETAGQYTGLTDKNGVKIFDGDVCKHHSSAYKNNLVSTWVDSQSCFSFIDRCDFDQHFYLQDIDMKHVEVIGNIYDNPDLIK